MKFKPWQIALVAVLVGICIVYFMNVREHATNPPVMYTLQEARDISVAFWQKIANNTKKPLSKKFAEDILAEIQSAPPLKHPNDHHQSAIIFNAMKCSPSNFSIDIMLGRSLVGGPYPVYPNYKIDNCP